MTYLLRLIFVGALLTLAGCLPDVTFTATPSEEDPENTSTLAWQVRPNQQVNVAEIVSVTLEPGFGEVELSGSEIVSPGETTEYMLVARARDQNGLIWTQEQTVTVYVGPLLENLVFTDDNLAACVEETGAVYIEEIQFLNCVDRNISDLSGMEHLTHLNILNIDNNEISDLSPLAHLPALHTLNIGANTIEDLTPVASMTALTALSIYNNMLTDLSPLADLDQLNALTFHNNQVVDLTPISNLPNITILSLSGNLVEDISPIANLTSLLVLDASFNALNSGVETLSTLENANLIRLDGNPDVSCLTYLQLLATLQVVTFTACDFP